MDELGRAGAAEVREAAKLPIVAVLDNIRSLHNVGSFFRTADALGLEKLILCGITGKPPHREIERSALGATESVVWQYFSTADAAAAELQTGGYTLYIAEQTNESKTLDTFMLPIPEKIAIFFGNEIQGVSETVFPYVSAAIEIPQYGAKHSLNVAVAAGIILYHFCRLIRTRHTPSDISN
jgi:tRNA G18 (ribose-2'-O)-methylase SpoU